MCYIKNTYKYYNNSSTLPLFKWTLTHTVHARNNWYSLSFITYTWEHDPCTHIWLIPIIFLCAVLRTFLCNLDKWSPWCKHRRPSVNKQINIWRHTWLNLYISKFFQWARKGQCKDKSWSLVLAPGFMDLWQLDHPCTLSTSWLESRHMQS